jgi:hypothetical protein
MLKKLFSQKWFVFVIHAVILLAVTTNSFYLMENFKVNKANLVLTQQKLQLEEDKKNLIDENSYEFLDSFKDKTIKKAGFKKTGEQVFDISNIDQKKDLKVESNQISNYQKWYSCLFSNQNSFTAQKNYTTESQDTNTDVNLCR